MRERNFEAGVTPKAFSLVYPYLYHMAHEDAWEQIQRYGLLSTKSILDVWEVKGLSQTQIRQSPVQLWHPRRGKVVIRDQKPMDEDKLRRALVDCTPEEWCQILNGKIFFWPTAKRLDTHMSARENRGKRHLVLTIDSYPLVTAYEKTITLCAMNSGTTIPFAHKRGRSSFVRMNQYPFQARLARGKYYTVVEVAVDRDIPDILAFVVSADYMTSSGSVQNISRCNAFGV